jgi:hypothetical protein
MSGVDLSKAGLDGLAEQFNAAGGELSPDEPVKKAEVVETEEVEIEAAESDPPGS